MDEKKLSFVSWRCKCLLLWLLRVCGHRRCCIVTDWISVWSGKFNRRTYNGIIIVWFCSVGANDWILFRNW